MSNVHTSGSHALEAATCHCAGTSLVARLDPRTRILAAFAFALALVSAEGLPALLAGLGSALVLAVLARLALVPTLRRLLALESFMVLVLVMLPFTIPGTPVAEFMGLSASAEGLRRAVAIMLKGNGVALAMLALLGTMEMPELGHALGRLGVPDRLVALFLFTTRYVEVLYQEYGRLRLAMRARAFTPRASIHTWRSMGWLVGMMMVMSLERADRIHAAMRCRGFTGRFHFDRGGRTAALDWSFGLAQAASLVVMLGLDLP